MENRVELYCVLIDLVKSLKLVAEKVGEIRRLNSIEENLKILLGELIVGEDKVKENS